MVDEAPLVSQQRELSANQAEQMQGGSIRGIRRQDEVLELYDYSDQKAILQECRDARGRIAPSGPVSFEGMPQALALHSWKPPSYEDPQNLLKCQKNVLRAIGASSNENAF